MHLDLALNIVCRRPRRLWLLRELHDHGGTLHVVTHRTAKGAALLYPTGESVSWSVTIRPLVLASLVELSDLRHLDDTWPAYHHRGRALTLTPTGLAAVTATASYEPRDHSHNRKAAR